jgi:hypothetical protein
MLLLQSGMSYDKYYLQHLIMSLVSFLSLPLLFRARTVPSKDTLCLGHALRGSRCIIPHIVCHNNFMLMTCPMHSFFSVSMLSFCFFCGQFRSEYEVWIEVIFIEYIMNEFGCFEYPNQVIEPLGDLVLYV